MGTFKESFACHWTDQSVRLISTPSRTARSTFFYVQEIGHFQTLPGYFTEREHLNSYLIVYTVAGKGYLNYRNRSHTLGPGQLFFIDCEERHHYATDQHNLWEIYWVHINGATSRGYYEQFAKGSDHVRSMNVQSPIPDLLLQLIRLQSQKDYRTEALSSKILVDLLTEILLTAYKPYPDFDVSPAFLPPMIDYLDKHYNEDIRLDRLAELFAVNKYHLSKEFKKVIGYTPKEYIINLRINKAKEWLKHTNASVEEIAGSVGIDNVSHFINLFKTRVELTPLAFRKKWHTARP
ncbi:AraC family transcriptional regulator [Paenibacillus hemerocallicola]|uniref:AraC family transcriptional regulator n=1 Tax=Paenibacillus hemerocallicola TaxID=1172614 RepID=A0A5C4TAJ3_9BACL|nr:AraC family transcriptional regulator [Paenibacillus hemerocallicola]TNJ66104.1 AraC family transcriptional regulator [Paenibacillus hemerocallicola]